MLTGVLEDKRLGQEPIPGNLDQFLNQLQVATLHKIEEFGWHLWFIRRPLFQTPVPVVASAGYGITAVLEEDGTMNKHHGLHIRP